MPTKQTTYTLSIRDILRAIEAHYKIPAKDIWKVAKDCTEFTPSQFEYESVELTTFTMSASRRKRGRKKGRK